MAAVVEEKKIELHPQFGEQNQKIRLNKENEFKKPKVLAVFTTCIKIQRRTQVCPWPAAPEDLRQCEAALLPDTNVFSLMYCQPTQ